jgi:protein-disulfide isomerase
MKIATALNIEGTPAYIVGNQIVPRAIDIETLAKLIAGERAKLGNTKTAAGSLAGKN